MDIERVNIISIAKLVVREVVQVSLKSQKLIIDGGTNSDLPHRNSVAEAPDVPFDKLLDIIEQCLCHGLRKDPLINESVLTLPSDLSSNKDNPFSPKSVFRRAKEQVYSTANSLINTTPNMPNPWPVILHMEQMLPNVERLSNNICMMSELRTGLGKSRVWIRQALMCKQLGNFFLHMAECQKGSSLPSAKLPNGASNDCASLTYITCPGHTSFYLPESLMVNEECVVFCGLLSGLSCVDFCCAIKDNFKDLDSGLPVLPYHLYLRPATDGIDQSFNKRTHSSAVDVAATTDQRNYLKEMNAKLQKRLEQSQAANHHVQGSLRAALDSVETMKLENRSLRITVDHLKRSGAVVRQVAGGTGLSVANHEDQPDCTSSVSGQTEKVTEISELKEHIKKLTLELEERKKQVSNLRSELSTILTDHEQLSHLYSRSQSLMDQKDMVIRHLEDKNTEMVNIMDQMKERLGKSESHRNTCERDASRLRLEIASLQERCNQQQTDIHAQRQMINSLDRQLDERAEQLVELQQCREILADYKQRNIQLSTALEKWRSRCEDQEDSLSELAAVVGSSKLEADSLRESLSAFLEARWVDDAEAEVCSRCEASFSMTRRRVSALGVYVWSVCRLWELRHVSLMLGTWHCTVDTGLSHQAVVG